jgi:hypothetical protein
VDWLAARGTIERSLAGRSHVADVVWAFAKVAEGMADAEGRPKVYSELAAIQLGSLLEAGAMRWDERARAANGRDLGCFVLDDDRLGSAIEQLARRVARAKARGDRDDAEAMRKAWVEGAGAWGKLREVIRERWGREPRPSYVYAVEL